MKSKALSMLVAAMLFAGAVHAAPIIFYGENQSPNQTVSGDPLTAHDAFLAQLTGVGTQDFESYAVNATAPFALNFAGSNGSITSSLSGSGFISRSLGSGRFNTSPGGSKYLEIDDQSFTITFSEGISAFGFYGTDIGDYSGQITLHLQGGGAVDLTVPNTINGNDGSLLFYGFIDPEVKYTSISFGNTAAGVDAFGFDDMIIGDRQQVVSDVPEPGSFALVGLALAGLGVVRRRRS